MTINNRFYITLEHTCIKPRRAYYFSILDSKNNRLYVSDSEIAELFGISLSEYKSKMFFNFSNHINLKDRMALLVFDSDKQKDKAFKLFKKAFKDNFVIMALS